MKSIFSHRSLDSTGLRPFSPRDYRLTYLQLDEEASRVQHAADATYRLSATAEFTFLGDVFLSILIKAIAATFRQCKRVDLADSHMPLQAWAECGFRNAGLSGLDLPEGIISRWKCRLQILEAILAHSLRENKHRRGGYRV